MHQKASLSTLALALCILAPLYSETVSENTENKTENSASFEPLLKEPSPADVQNNSAEQGISQTNENTSTESKDSLQTASQQGTSSQYDCNSSCQNDSSGMPQDASKPDSSSAKSKRPAAYARVQNKNTAQPETTTKVVKQVEHYNTAVKPALKNALNLWVNGEALLWQATEENLTYVYKTDLDGHVDLKTLDFEWDWGFRVSGGYNIPRDGWSLALMWTHLENHASNSQKAHLDENGNGIGSMPYLQASWGINDFSPPSGTITQSNAHWTVHLDQVDLEIGREYYAGKHLTLRPHCGLRADWIDQNYKTTYHFFSDSHPQKFTMSNRFFGFGFFAGVDSNWLFGQGFSLFGTADVGILLGFFKVDEKVRQVNNLLFQTKGTLDNSFRCGRGILDLELGLKWSHLFSQDSWGLTFKAGYEYHLYFDQNQLSNITSNAPVQYIKTNGNLIYQGVSLSGQIDF